MPSGDHGPAQFDSQPWPSRNERGYDIPDVPYGTLRYRKVICIGAGISGIGLAKELDVHGENVELAIYETGDG